MSGRRRTCRARSPRTNPVTPPGSPSPAPPPPPPPAAPAPRPAHLDDHPRRAAGGRRCVVVLQAETVDRILRLRGGGLPVLGLDARVDPDDRRASSSRVDEQLHEVRLLTKDSGRDRDARLSLRGDVAR